MDLKSCFSNYYRGRYYFFKEIQGSSEKMKDLEIENEILKKLLPYSSKINN